MLRELERFDPALPVESARTPPSAWYTDPVFLDLERRSLFRDTWQAVGPTDRVRRPGEFLSGEIAGEPFVVVRGKDGTLRGFFNVCRHHASCLVTGHGRIEKLTCPYHGWEYGLDGRLERAPRLGAVTSFDREQHGLRTIEVGEWGPLVLAKLAPGGPSLVEWMQPLEGRLDWTGLRFATRRSYELRCNWKVFVDNYLDGGYHVDHLHRGLASQLDLSSYDIEIDRHVSFQTCSAGGEGDQGIDFPERIGGRAVYAFVYPNLMLNRYGPILDTNWVLPLDAGRTLTVFDYWFDPAAGDQEFVKRSLEASDRVQREDVGVCESVQRGLGSSAFDSGPYAPRLEIAAHRFHCLLAQDLVRAAHAAP